jgi:hypothetical protein
VYGRRLGKTGGVKLAAKKSAQKSPQEFSSEEPSKAKLSPVIFLWEAEPKILAEYAPAMMKD